MIQDMEEDEYNPEDEQHVSDSPPATEVNKKKTRFQNSSEESDIMNTDQEFDSGIN